MIFPTTNISSEADAEYLLPLLSEHFRSDRALTVKSIRISECTPFVGNYIVHTFSNQELHTVRIGVEAHGDAYAAISCHKAQRLSSDPKILAKIFEALAANSATMLDVRYAPFMTRYMWAQGLFTLRVTTVHLSLHNEMCITLCDALLHALGVRPDTAPIKPRKFPALQSIHLVALYKRSRDSKEFDVLLSRSLHKLIEVFGRYKGLGSSFPLFSVSLGTFKCTLHSRLADIISGLVQVFLLNGEVYKKSTLEY
jgi:hypothetical protein